MAGHAVALSRPTQPIGLLRSITRKLDWRLVQRLTAGAIVLAGTTGTPTRNKLVRRASVSAVPVRTINAPAKRCGCDVARLTGALARTRWKTFPRDREWTESSAPGLDGKRRCRALTEAPAQAMPNAGCPKAALRQGLVRRDSKTLILKVQKGNQMSDTIQTAQVSREKSRPLPLRSPRSEKTACG